MKIPDVVGLGLEDARQLLNNMGLAIENIKVTAPPREKSGEYNEYYRVIRTRMINDEKIELLICKPL